MKLLNVLTLSLVLTGLLGSPLIAADGVPLERAKQARQRGVEFLKSTQNEDGSWNAPSPLGVSGIVVTALLKSGVPADDPVIQKGLDYLTSHAKEDGGIYSEGLVHRNYETSIALMAIEEAGPVAKHEPLVEKAVAFLKDLQWDEGESTSPSDPAYGGQGYGGHQRPDLSNTQFFIEALKSAGVGEDDPAFEKALVFISRTQNLESEHNTTPFASKVNDGGFYYTPAAGGTSQAGETPNGGLRSYGSMTYAGLKSMIHAGLSEDDPRVKAANEWIRQHYTLEENPGMGQQGLYYYYHTFARALDVLGEETIVDAQGQTHDWQADLAKELISRQKENGYWTNEADRWYEGDPHLVTAYALLALSYVLPEDGN